MPNAKSIPLSAHELRDAIRHGQRYDASRLDRVLRPEDRGLIEVQAGVQWRDIASLLRPGDTESEAASLRATMRSIGDSIARNTAGPDGRPVVNHIESLTLVTPEGELRRINRVAHGALFSLVIGGQGLFGTLYSATLRVNSLLRSADETIKAAEPPAPINDDPRAIHLLVPPAALERFVADAQARCDEWRVEVKGVDVRHTLPEEDTFLRWARKEYTEVGLQLAPLSTIGGAVRNAQLRRDLIDVAIAAGGSFPISRSLDASRDQITACYPELPQFLAEKRQIDPADKLVTSWYLHHRNLFTREPCKVSWCSDK